MLLNAEVEGERLTDLEFDLFFELLAVAGNETTRNLISHGMLALIENPGERDKLLADPIAAARRPSTRCCATRHR